MAPNLRSWCDTCFCFRDTQRSVTAIGMFAMGTSIVQLFITIAVFTGFNEKEPISLSPLDDKAVITYILYITLACFDFLNFLFAIFLLYGNERTNELKARGYYLPWIILQPFYAIFESGTNIYYFYNQFNQQYSEPLSMGHYTGLIIVPMVYWIIKTLLIILAFTFMVIRYQTLGLELLHFLTQGQTSCGGGATTGGCSGCYDCNKGPTMHAPITLPPSMPACTSCSGGACGGSRCTQCNKPQPLYGYASGQASSGNWKTNFFSR